MLADTFPGLSQIGQTHALSEILSRAQNTDLWASRMQKIEQKYDSKRQEAKVNDRLIQKTVAFQQNQVLRTVFSEKIKKMEKKARKENVAHWERFKTENVQRIAQENKDFAAALEEFQQRWSHLLNLEAKTIACHPEKQEEEEKKHHSESESEEEHGHSSDQIFSTEERSEQDEEEISSNVSSTTEIIPEEAFPPSPSPSSSVTEFTSESESEKEEEK